MHRADMCDTLGFVLLEQMARGSRASPLPSVHTPHRRGTYRYAAAPVSPRLCLFLLLYVSLYLPLSFLSLSPCTFARRRRSRFNNRSDR